MAAAAGHSQGIRVEPCSVPCVVPAGGRLAAADELGSTSASRCRFGSTATYMCRRSATPLPTAAISCTEALNHFSRLRQPPILFILLQRGKRKIWVSFSLLEEITTAVKAIDPRRLYTLTSNFDHPLLPCEDYLCAFRAAGHPVRIQHCQDRAAESTALDYADAVADTPVPVISFEVGQYCVYPDTDCIADYSGAMRPINFEAVRKLAQQSGVYERRQDYIDASGNLAAKLYKEDIEAALRTPDFGGFELLSLTDYTGQKTATVGLLDVFGRSKGILTADEFRRFAGPVVPLFKAKRIFTTTEFLDAALSLYDFGPEPTQDLCYDVTIREGDAVFCHIKTRKPMLHIPLSSLDHSAQLDVTVAVGTYSNSWRIFVLRIPRILPCRLFTRQPNWKKFAKPEAAPLCRVSCFPNRSPATYSGVLVAGTFSPARRPAA